MRETLKRSAVGTTISLSPAVSSSEANLLRNATGTVCPDLFIDSDSRNVGGHSNEGIQGDVYSAEGVRRYL